MLRTWRRLMMMALVPVIAVTGCSDDDDPVGVNDDDPLEAFVGSWSATSFVYTSVDNPDISIPVLEVVEGSSVGVTVTGDGSFVASLNLGEQTGGETVDIPGTIEHEGEGRITVTFAENPFFTALDVTYEFEGPDILAWEAPTTFDFNQDGEETDAILSVVFVRS